jgi:hypothetical protein
MDSLLFGHPCTKGTECTLKVKPSEKNRVKRVIHQMNSPGKKIWGLNFLHKP